MIKARVKGGTLLAAGMDGESMKVLVEGVLKTRSFSYRRHGWRVCGGPVGGQDRGQVRERSAFCRRDAW